MAASSGLRGGAAGASRCRSACRAPGAPEREGRHSATLVSGSEGTAGRAGRPKEAGGGAGRTLSGTPFPPKARRRRSVRRRKPLRRRAIALSPREPHPTANRSNRWRFSSAGSLSRTPASREALAQSRSKSYCRCSWRPPNHCIPLGEMTQTTLATSHGPRHPEIVSCTDLLSFPSFHCCLIQSRGSGGNPLSARPQQQPSQSTICPRTRPRAVAKGSCLTSASRMRRV